MDIKNMQNIIGKILIVFVAASSSLYAGGSILVYNNSFYKVNFVVTTQNGSAPAEYIQAALVPAPTNQDGTLQTHPADTNYSAGSNVPLGTVSNVVFTDPAKNFDLQIIDATGVVVKQINVGSSLGAVVDTDPARAVYIYSNVNNAGVAVSNVGGAVYFWDVAHSLASPAVQTF